MGSGAPVEAGAAVLPKEHDAGPRELVAKGAARWRSLPRESNGFWPVLDGLCSQLTTTRVGKDVVVHYGGGSRGLYKDGIRLGAASFAGLRDAGLERIGDPRVAFPTGTAGSSLDEFWVADSTGSRSDEGAVLHRRTGGTWKTYGRDQTHLHAWIDGGIIGTLGMAVNNGEIWVEGSNVRPPDALHANMFYPGLAAFPTGDVLLFGDLGQAGGPPVARHWAPGKKITEFKLGAHFRQDHGVETAPDEIYLWDDALVLRWDGTNFRPAGKPLGGRALARVLRAEKDVLWALTEAGTLERLTPDRATEIATPERVQDIDGVDTTPWFVSASGKLYKRQGDEWKSVPLPVPVYSAGATLKAKSVTVVAEGDVLLTAAYWEKGPGWSEPELHTALFRTKAVEETLRCNEPDPENNNVNIGNGFQSWPPMATADCTTPFAVLARRSNEVRKVDDWPRLRAALKGHTELGTVSLVEFVSGGRTLVGVKTNDVGTATKIAALAVKKDRLRPEVVCGDPEPTRTLTIDLATGNVK